MSSNIQSLNNDPTMRWMQLSPPCQGDLALKKTALIITSIINLAAVGAALYYLTIQFNLPTTALILAPFIAGIIGSLISLKIPTAGVTTINSSYITNPAYIAARIFTYIFFAPISAFLYFMDLTNYADPIEARKISQELREGDFKKIILTYGPKSDNLEKYGFLEQEQAEELKNIYKTSKRTLNFIKKGSLNGDGLEIENARWLRLKESLNLPGPKLPTEDSWFRVKQFIHEYFGFSLFSQKAMTPEGLS